MVFRIKQGGRDRLCQTLNMTDHGKGIHRVNRGMWLHGPVYAVGFDKKEIAEKKHRSLHTIINQLRTAFEVLGVRNGRELAIKLCERLCDIKANVNIQQMVHSAVACVLLLILCVDSHLEMRRARQRCRSIARIEISSRAFRGCRGRNITL